MGTRAERFTYLGLEIDGTTLVGRYQLDDVQYVETVVFEGVESFNSAAVRSLAEVWFLLAGLSYYKAGAARHIDFAATPVSNSDAALFRAALLDGLGEFAYRNDLDLSDVVISGGIATHPLDIALDPHRILTPFGGGIDSVVTVHTLGTRIDQSLFVVSPSTGRFEPLENTAQLTGRPILRATRSLDPLIVTGERVFNGHVPVTAMFTLLAAIAAVADGRGAVAMSNEHSSSVPNRVWRGREINHQWSKSWAAEQLISASIRERLGPQFTIASVLRDRSELWVAREFAQLTQYHHTFRSCNRAFRQQLDQREANWCGECDKCLFIGLVLAPFMSRDDLRSALGCEPLGDNDRRGQLKTLVGLGTEFKPFECVGDPSECSVALRELHSRTEWRDVQNVAVIGPMVSTDLSFDDMFNSQGVSGVPADWLR